MPTLRPHNADQIADNLTHTRQQYADQARAARALDADENPDAREYARQVIAHAQTTYPNPARAHGEYWLHLASQHDAAARKHAEQRDAYRLQGNARAAQHHDMEAERCEALAADLIACAHGA